MNAVTIERMEEKHMLDLGRVLGRAFNNDPLWLYVFENDKTRLDLLTWFWYRFEYTSLYHNPNSYVAICNNAVVGVINMVEPTDTKPNLWTRALAGQLKTPFKVGIGSLRKMLRTEKVHDTLVESVGPNVLLLDHLAVDPELHGKGSGANLVQKAIELADSNLQWTNDTKYKCSKEYHIL
jgi:predicted GNAT family acetyltransferase